jgi:hypothetical protein
MERNCDNCGKPFEAKSYKAQFCGATCRQRAHRAATSGDSAPVPVPAAPRAAWSPVPVDVAATSRESVAVWLAEVGAAGPMVAVALKIAERIDGNRDSGQGLSSLAARLSVVLADLAATAPALGEPNPLEIIRATREIRLGSKDPGPQAIVARVRAIRRPLDDAEQRLIDTVEARAK